MYQYTIGISISFPSRLLKPSIARNSNFNDNQLSMWVCSKHEDKHEIDCLYPESKGEYFHDALKRKKSRQSRVQVMQSHLVSLRLFVILRREKWTSLIEEKHPRTAKR